MYSTDSDAVRTEALFLSPLQPSEQAAPVQIRRAVHDAVRRFGRTGCAALVAQEFGDHPDTAVRRMRWCVRAVQDAYPVPGDTLMVIDTGRGQLVRSPLARVRPRWRTRRP